MTFANGIVSLQKVTANTLSGTYDKTNNQIGSYSLADGAALFDLSANEAGNDAAVTKIDPADITKSFINKEDVIAYAVTTDFGDIGVILFDNITKSDLQYGILTDKNVRDSGMSISGTYTCLLYTSTIAVRRIGGLHGQVPHFRHRYQKRL